MNKTKIRFWGCRGSFPTPDANKIGFGGDTSCVSIETQEQISLDRNESMDFTNNLTNYARYYLWGHNIVTQDVEDKNYINLTREEILRVSRHVFSTNNLYISYASSHNLNKKINEIIDAQDY